MHKYTHTVQTHDVQESTVISKGMNTWPLDLCTCYSLCKEWWSLLLHLPNCSNQTSEISSSKKPSLSIPFLLPKASVYISAVIIFSLRALTMISVDRARSASPGWPCGQAQPGLEQIGGDEWNKHVDSFPVLQVTTGFLYSSPLHMLFPYLEHQSLPYLLI